MTEIVRAVRDRVIASGNRFRGAYRGDGATPRIRISTDPPRSLQTCSQRRIWAGVRHHRTGGRP